MEVGSERLPAHVLSACSVDVSRPLSQGKAVLPEAGAKRLAPLDPLLALTPHIQTISTSSHLHLQSGPECVSLQPCWCRPVQPPGPSWAVAASPCLAQTASGGCPRPRVKPRPHGPFVWARGPSGLSPALVLALRLPHGPPRSACAASAFSSLWNVRPPVPTPQGLASGLPRGSVSQRPALTAGSQGCSPPPLPA